jgi:hypothetical protein
MLYRFGEEIIVGCLCLSVLGCATVTLDMHATGHRPPIIKSDITEGKVLVLWGTAWRSNQKEAARREDIASQAIAEFFEKTIGPRAVIRKVIDGKPALELSDTQIMQSRDVKEAQFNKVVLLRLEELGPTLSFYLSPILWKGSTDVSFNLSVLDVSSSSLLSDIRVHWEKGGAFALRGTSTLKEGLKSALSEVFQEAG